MDDQEHEEYFRSNYLHKDIEYTHDIAKYDLGWCGNFKGFIQLRKTFENENRKDLRVIKKMIYEIHPTIRNIIFRFEK